MIHNPWRTLWMMTAPLQVLLCQHSKAHTQDRGSAVSQTSEDRRLVKAVAVDRDDRSNTFVKEQCAAAVPLAGACWEGLDQAVLDKRPDSLFVGQTAPDVRLHLVASVDRAGRSLRDKQPVSEQTVGKPEFAVRR